MTTIEYLFAKSNATVALEGGGQAVIRMGDHWWAYDEVVRAHPDMFTSNPRPGLKCTRVPPGFDDESPVESTTAGPGERRSTRRTPLDK